MNNFNDADFTNDDNDQLHAMVDKSEGRGRDLNDIMEVSSNDPEDDRQFGGDDLFDQTQQGKYETYPPTKSSKKMQQTKALTLEETMIEAQQKLSEKSSIENKIAALKKIGEAIKTAKNNSTESNTLLHWLEAMNLINNYFYEDSHPQILRNMPQVIRFMYENGKIDFNWLSTYVEIALKANQEFGKVIQNLMLFLNIEDLSAVFNLVANESHLESHNLPLLLSNIASNKVFMEGYSGNVHSKKDKKDNEYFMDQKQTWEQNILNGVLDDPEIKQNHVSEDLRELTHKLFKFLIEATDKHMNVYFPILSKLISAKHIILTNQLLATLPELLKNGKVNAIWMLEHCLKMDFGQPGKQKGSKNQTRFAFILKLVNEHLYEYLLIILSRVRFNKLVVDKILNIFILLSKNYKPLDDVYTQYIWRILGENSREEKERQQFFNFVRDILRNESNFTEESVYFIFFEVLMNLKAEWFSLKIIDCLEMLFMRLNEDLKLISYSDQTYEIQDPDLVGIDKLWYIYFYSNDAKVIKKCKDLLWKLATYTNKPQIAQSMLQQYIEKCISYMSDGLEQNKCDVTSKGFDMIDRMLEQNQKKESTTQYVHINVTNQCSEALAPKSVMLRLNEKSSLSHLKEQIGMLINPSNTNIRLLLRGQFLKGQKMTLKDLNIENGNTIMVIDDEPIAPKPDELKVRKQVLKNTVQKLEQIFAGTMQAGLLQFIAQKMQGHQIQKIMEAIMTDDKLKTMTVEYNEAQEQRQPQQKPAKNHLQVVINRKQESEMKQQQAQPQKQPEDQQVKSNFSALELQFRQKSLSKFGSILAQNSEYIIKLLKCASDGDPKRSWQSIKKMPISPAYVSQVRFFCHNRQWDSIFSSQQQNSLLYAYNAHVLRYIFKVDKRKIRKYMVSAGGFAYIVSWLQKFEVGSNNIVLCEVAAVLAAALEQDFDPILNFRKRINKKQQKNQLNHLIEENSMQNRPKYAQLTTYCTTNLLKYLLSTLTSPIQGPMQGGSAVFQIILASILINSESPSTVLSLPLNQIHLIIQKHGFLGEYIFLALLSKLFTQNSPQLDQAYSKLLQLTTYCFDFMSEQTQKTNIVYFFDLVASILQVRANNPQTEQDIAAKCMHKFVEECEKMEHGHLHSMLGLLKMCLAKTYNSMEGVDQETNKKYLDFAVNLFAGHLFNLESSNKHMRDRAIRKICYEILEVIAKDSYANAQTIADQVLNIELKQIQKQEDYIDFKSSEYIGLRNLGATCYINSLLQQIYHTKFSKLLLQKGDRAQEHVQKIKQLKKIFMQLCYSIKNVVNPRDFIKNMRLAGEPINPSVQQDATEFLLSLFDYIESEGCQEQVYDVFGGFLCNQIAVDASETDQAIVKNNMEHFNSLTIDIKGKKNLQEALAYFIKPQILDGDNKYDCEELGKKMKAQRRCYIQKMPNILIITLKRFEFDYDSQLRHKLNDYFEFPHELDMHKYSAAHLRNKEENSDSKYKLAGILVHSGSAESGHYYSYVKRGQNWYEFNDKLVSEFNVQNNLKNECFGCSEGKKSRSAYMLFYEKVNISYHGVYLDEIPESNIYKQQVISENAIFLKTRLVYDENFRKLIESLCATTSDKRLKQFITKIYGEKRVIKPKQEGSKTVYFDADDNADDQNQPLLNKSQDPDDEFM